MISNKKYFFLLIIIMLVVAACSGEETTSQSPEESVAAQPTAAVATAAEPTAAVDPTQEPAADTPTLEPTPTEVQATAETEPETAEPQPTAAEAETAPTAEGQINGRYETTYFRGSETAPVTMIDYSDFLWTACRAYVLGTEPDVVEMYVDTGDVRLVYWPMLDHGNASLNAHAASECIGRQDVDAFWEIHDRFYANQGELWSASRDYFVDAAVSVGVDQAAFEACYDNQEGHAVVTELDTIRRERGIFNRPTFDINGQMLLGSQPFSTFMGFIDAFLNG